MTSCSTTVKMKYITKFPKIVAMLPNAINAMSILPWCSLSLLKSRKKIPSSQLQPTNQHSLCNNNQQDQNNNEHHNHRQTPILPRLSRKTIKSAPRSLKLRLVPIHTLLHII